MMKIFLLSVLLSLQLPIVSHALQWREVNANPGVAIRAMTANDDELFAVGQSLILESDAEVSWRRISEGNQRYPTFESITLDSDGNVIAGGSSHNIWIRNEGEWRDVTDTLGADRHARKWLGVSFGDGKRALAVGSGGHTAVSTDAGNSWQYPIFSLSNDGGVTWSDPTPSRGYVIGSGTDSVELRDATFAWGGFWIVGEVSSVLREAPEESAGAAVDLALISTQLDSSTQEWHTIEFADGRLVAGGGPGSVIATTSDGEAWESKFLSSRFGESFVVDLAFGPAGWIALTNFNTIYTSNDARIWKDAPQMETDAQISSVTVLGESFYAAGEGGVVLRLDPSEKVWRTEREALATPHKHGGLSFFKGWFLSSELEKTHDYGLTWDRASITELKELYGELSGWDLRDEEVWLSFERRLPHSEPLSDDLGEAEFTILKSVDAENWELVRQDRRSLKKQAPFHYSRYVLSERNIFQIEHVDVGTISDAYFRKTSKVTLLGSDHDDAFREIEIDGEITHFTQAGDELVMAGTWITKNVPFELGENGPRVYSSRFALFVHLSQDGGRTWTEFRWELEEESERVSLEQVGDEYVAGIGEHLYRINVNGQWSELEFPEIGELQALAYGAGLLVAGGSDGRLATSDDLDAWSVLTVPYFHHVDSIAYGNGEFLVSNGQSTYLHGRTSLWSEDWFERDGWIFAKWFGWFYPSTDSAWQWHLEHGWIYNPTTSLKSGFWVWDGEMDSWWYTTADWYPNVFSGTKEEWLYFVPGDNGRTFSSYDDKGSIYTLQRNG